MKRSLLIACCLVPIFDSSLASAAGTLKLTNSAQAPIRIDSHAVDVKIRDGFARTTVRQVFVNPNPTAQEAIYSHPLPKSAALADVTVANGDAVMLRGEVVERAKARQAYEEERDSGNSAAVAEKNSYQSFDFTIANLPPSVPVTVTFTYYQSLSLDTGVGRYAYPLENGGTDDTRLPFWQEHTAVDNTLSFHLELDSAYPVDKVHVPGFSGASITKSADQESYVVDWTAPSGALDKDFVVYYALADQLPARVELVPYRGSDATPGTFQLVVTPGVDLAPLTLGSDITFVLDVSGSMQAKLATLADGVARSLTELKAGDRFRIITFAEDAQRLTRGFIPATPESVHAAVEAVKRLTVRGGTNVYSGVEAALEDLDADRVQSIVLVTDGVANVGELSPKAFVKLLTKVDVRVFGFLLGNGSNWPLMEAITKASGGFYEAVSNSDEIVTRLALAKQKITHEAMHAVRLEIDGSEVFDVDDGNFGNVYHGQQLIAFGRYRAGCEATVTLKCKITGEAKTYRATFSLPPLDDSNPEIERMFALHRTERLGALADAGLLDLGESKQAIRDLGLQYQIVTDETSMLVLADEAFARRGIERKNQSRLETEAKAAAAKRTQNVVDRRVDKSQPMFQGNSASRNSGAFDGIFVVLSGLTLLAAFFVTSKRS